MTYKRKDNGIAAYILFILLFALVALLFFSLSLLINGPQEKTRQVTEKALPFPTIIIDAGHGGEDGGTVGIGGLYEKNVNLDIAFMLHDILVSEGYNVVLTRDEDILLYDRSVDYKGRKKALDLAARVKIAEEAGYCIFVSIHMNSFPDPRYSGLQVYYSQNNKNSYLLAEEIQSLVRSSLQPKNNRKTKPAGSNIFVLDRISSPAILIECGFLSSPEECAALASNEYKQKLSLIISLAIQKYICATT